MAANGAASHHDVCDGASGSGKALNSWAEFPYRFIKFIFAVVYLFESRNV
jgi:hypothetical protein